MEYVRIESMKTIDEDIKNGQFKSVYLLYGSEDYLKKQYRDKLCRALVGEGDTMNFSKFEGENIVVEEMIDLSETLPFFADYRVILVEDSGFFKKSNETLAEYLQECPETTHFIFVESEIDKRSKTYKAANKNGSAVEFTMLDERMLAQWIGARLKAEGKTITRDAWAEFLNRTNDSMENMDKEIEKLISYTHDKDGITKEDIEAICIGQIHTQVFEMINCIAQKDPKRVLEYYHDMLAAKEPPMRILFLIVRQFRQMIVIKELAANRVDNSSIARKVGMPDFAVRKNLGLCRNFSIPQMQELLIDAADCETQVKTGQLDERMAVELLMMKYAKA